MGIRHIDYPILSIKYRAIVDFLRLARLMRANAEPLPSLALRAGSHLFAFPAGVEQASAPIYANGAKNTGF